MPLYHYQALDSRAGRHQGVIEAPNEKEARAKLRERGLMVSSLSTKAKISTRQNFDKESLVTFTLQLSQMINSGVPIYESLLTIEEQYRKDPFHPILLSLCDQIKRGASLSEAMQGFPGSFDSLYTSMIAAGEASGALGLILKRLTELLKKQLKLKKEVSTAMIYPAILASFSLLIIGLLMGFVVPSIEGIFEGRELNTFTTIVLSASHFLREMWWIYLPVAALLIGGFIYYIRTEKGRLQIELILLNTPIISQLVIQAALARFTRTMGTLQQGGLTMIESLRMARGVMRNQTLEKEMVEAEENIIEGSSLSIQLDRSKYIPTIVARMVAIGEETGNTVGMFNNIADMYEETLEKTLTRVVALAQPVILIVMGGMIGLVMMAILLPLTDVAAFTT